MKKIFVILLTLILVFSLVACGNDSNSDSVDAIPASPGESNNEDSATSHDGQGTLGDYDVSFTGYVLAKDYEDNDAIIISYDFTNNSEETVSAMVALQIQAFQDGIELESAILFDAPEGYNSENEWKDIKTGATLNCQAVFVLSNTSSPVEVEASEFISFSDAVVSCTYDIVNG